MRRGREASPRSGARKKTSVRRKEKKARTGPHRSTDDPESRVGSRFLGSPCKPRTRDRPARRIREVRRRSRSTVRCPPSRNDRLGPNRTRTGFARPLRPSLQDRIMARDVGSSAPRPLFQETETAGWAFRRANGGPDLAPVLSRLATNCLARSFVRIEARRKSGRARSFSTSREPGFRPCRVRFA